MPTATIDADIRRAEGRVEKLARAVGDAPDIAPLLDQLRKADEDLKRLRAARAKTPGAPAVAAKLPSAKEIRAYFENLADTLESEAEGARDVLRGAFSRITLSPLQDHYRVEMILSEVRRNGHCGGRI